MDKTRSLPSLMQAARAFQESRVLLTALELDVFTALGSGANTYTESEYRTWLGEAGLGAIVRPHPQGDVLVAAKA